MLKFSKSCDMSTTVLFFEMDNIVPLTAPVNQSLVPKSVVSVIICILFYQDPLAPPPPLLPPPKPPKLPDEKPPPPTEDPQ